MHAKGTLEQVVQSAIQRKFTSYGLSEHMPRYKADQLYPEESHLTTRDLERMFDQFLQEAERLQRKYSDQICLLIGLETEYFGASSIEYVKGLRQPNRRSTWKAVHSSNNEVESGELDISLPQVQYIVGSLHHIHGIPLDFSPELYLNALDKVGGGSWEVLFKEYFNSQYEMLQGLEPEVVGHLDLVRIFFSSITTSQNELTDELWALVKRNIDFVISYGGLFELNSRAWKKGLLDAYPQRDILQHILSKDGRVTLSDDSHGPDDVGMFYDPELKNYLELMKVDKVYYLAPNTGEQDRPYTTAASNKTGSFQHVHVRSIPLTMLEFNKK
ncbi:histidinolphosphatase [Entomortierella beljakovae]|nr:histidinolphosphatase [Entomortierella beljakovae]